MADLKTFNDAVNLAIKKEKEAVTFYIQAAEIVKNPGTRTMLKEFVTAEEKHVKILKEAKESETMAKVGTKPLPPSMDLTKYLVNEPITENSTPQDVMIAAMKREELAIALYTEQTAAFSGTALASIFQNLLQWEKEHKEWLEAEYDKVILKDN